MKRSIPAFAVLCLIPVGAYLSMILIQTVFLFGVNILTAWFVLAAVIFIAKIFLSSQRKFVSLGLGGLAVAAAGLTALLLSPLGLFWMVLGFLIVLYLADTLVWSSSTPAIKDRFHQNYKLAVEILSRHGA